MDTFLAYFYYYLGDLCWKLVCWTDWNEITRKIIAAPCWSLYTKFMNLSLEYDEKVGYVVWKSNDNE